MRIGINASFLRKPGTGIGQVTLHFLKELAESHSLLSGSEYILYCEESPNLDFSLPENFTVRSFLPRFWKRDDLVRKVLWERQVAREAEKDGCDAFLSLYQVSTVTPEQMHHTMVVHDLIPELFPQYQGNIRQRYHWRVVRKAIMKAEKIITVSQSTEHDLVEFGVDKNNIVVAYPDTSPIFRTLPSQEEEKTTLEKHDLVPGYIYHGGGLEVRKNTEGVLRAYRLLVDKEEGGALSFTLPPLAISGKIFSEDNPLATPVERLIKELRLVDRVHLLGFVPEHDLPTLYKNALFFVYPSFYEGFGLPVLEALRMKTPVLTSDISSLPEIAKDAALYVDPEKIESLASGMERLIVDVSLRQSLSEAGAKDDARFDWRLFTDRVLQTISVSSPK